jgi:hypothetical protein
MTETIYLHTCTNKCINSIFHEAMKKPKKKGGGIKAVTQRTDNAMATNGQKYKQ